MIWGILNTPLSTFHTKFNTQPSTLNTKNGGSPPKKEMNRRLIYVIGKVGAY